MRCDGNKEDVDICVIMDEDGSNGYNIIIKRMVIMDIHIKIGLGLFSRTFGRKSDYSVIHKTPGHGHPGPDVNINMIVKSNPRMLR